jgi:DNA-binding transcriptional LysR family regulator
LARAISDSGLVATRVGAVHYVICANPGYQEKHGVPKTPADLAMHDCITFDNAATATVWTFAARGGRKTVQSVHIRSRLSVNTAYQAAEAVSQGKLKIVLGAFESEPLPVNLVHAGQGLLPLKIRALLEFAAPQIRRRLAALPTTLQSRAPDKPGRTR